MVYFAKGLALSGKGFAEAVFGFRGVKVLAVGFGSGEDRILDPASVRVGVRVWVGGGCWGGTERVWAFRVEERRADIAAAKDVGSLLDCFFRSYG